MNTLYAVKKDRHAELAAQKRLEDAKARKDNHVRARAKTWGKFTDSSRAERRNVRKNLRDSVDF